MEKTIVAAVHAPEGDYRDWDEVKRFADQIAEALLMTPATG